MGKTTEYLYPLHDKYNHGCTNQGKLSLLLGEIHWNPNLINFRGFRGFSGQKYLQKCNLDTGNDCKMAQVFWDVTILINMYHSLNWAVQKWKWAEQRGQQHFFDPLENNRAKIKVPSVFKNEKNRLQWYWAEQTTFWRIKITGIRE